MKALQRSLSRGYHRLETNDEVLVRLRKEDIHPRRTTGFILGQTFDEWLDINNQARKMIYVP